MAQVKIDPSDASIRLAAEQFLGLGKDGIKDVSMTILEGKMREVIGAMTVEEIFRGRYEFSAKVSDVTQDDFSSMGLLMISFALKDISDTQGYLDALGKPQIAAAKRDAAIAEAEYVVVAPHNPCGPVATAVNVHFALSTHNFAVLEYKPDDVPDRCDLVDEPVALEDGYLLPPTRPGLGLDLNLEACSKYMYKSWHRSFLWRVDGSLGYQ